MNQYVKKYLLRGLIFSGLGPIVVGIVYSILEFNGVELNLTGKDVLLAVISSYLMAFVHAGISVLPTIETWSKPKIWAIQLSQLYAVYTIGYLLNRWLPFSWLPLTIYTTAFIVGFVVIWIISILTGKALTRNLNKKLKEMKKSEE